MGLGFLAGFGLATLGLLAVAAVVGWGALLYRSYDNLTDGEPWWYSEPLGVTLILAAIIYVIAIVFLSAGA